MEDRRAPLPLKNLRHQAGEAQTRRLGVAGQPGLHATLQGVSLHVIKKMGKNPEFKRLALWSA